MWIEIQRPRRLSHHGIHEHAPSAHQIPAVVDGFSSSLPGVDRNLPGKRPVPRASATTQSVQARRYRYSNRCPKDCRTVLAKRYNLRHQRAQGCRLRSRERPPLRHCT